MNRGVRLETRDDGRVVDAVVPVRWLVIPVAPDRRQRAPMEDPCRWTVEKLLEPRALDRLERRRSNTGRPLRSLTTPLALASEQASRVGGPRGMCRSAASTLSGPTDVRHRLALPARGDGREGSPSREGRALEKRIRDGSECCGTRSSTSSSSSACASAQSGLVYGDRCWECTRCCCCGAVAPSQAKRGIACASGGTRECTITPLATISVADWFARERPSVEDDRCGAEGCAESVFAAGGGTAAAGECDMAA
mmetsp:Transcript_19061/g.59168  ORF Transcript_19061/g.59168 Transcript_19061/m.59168 type:complete len:252 (-) Transcript_19061:284-1039(-)